MKTKKNFLLSVVTILVLFLQMVSPIIVFADGETTPPPEETTEVTTTPDPTEETEVPEITSTPLSPEPTADPVETDTPILPADSTELPPEPTADSTEPPTETSEPTVDPVETEAPFLPEDQTEQVEASATAEEVIEEPTVAEILEEIPAGADLVVLDENGEPEPLATQEAAEIIATSDPMWCPDGVLPGGAGCTSGYATVSELNAALSSGIYSGSGTIYFTPTYSTNDVTFDGYALYRLTDLTIQGGWNGLTGSSYALSGNTIFNSVPVRIMDWNGNVTVNNITVDGSVGSGLVVQTNGSDVSINDSSFMNNQLDSDGYSPYYYGDGAGILTNGGNITVDNSHFDENYWDGLWAPDAGQITITNSTFNGNQIGNGVNSYAANQIAIANSTFSGNGNDGLFVYADTAGQTSNVFVSNSAFSGNVVGLDASTWDDEYGESIGSIILTLNCVQFTNNIQNILQSGDVTVTDNPCPPPPPSDRDNDGIIDGEDACPDVPGIKTDDPLTNGCPLLPIIPVDGNSIAFSIDCSLFSSYMPVWPNGDRILISCVPNGTVTIDRVENTSLPDDLDAGYQYASGFNVQVFQNGAPLSVMPEGGSIQVSFVAEGDVQYGIMYWDESANDWILLEEFQLNPNGTWMQFSLGTQDLRTILKGAQFTSGNPNRENVTTNFMGTYILVARE